MWTLGRKRLAVFQCVQTMSVVVAPYFQTAVSAPVINLGNSLLSGSHVRDLTD